MTSPTETMGSQAGFAKDDAAKTEKELKPTVAGRPNLIDGLSTHFLPAEANDHDTLLSSAKDQSEDRENPRQGSDTGHSQGHCSPVFLSDRFTPEQAYMEEAPGGLPRRRGIAVVVPPLERRWEYRVYKEKTTIDRVLKQSTKSGQLQYLVKFIDAQELLVSYMNFGVIKVMSSFFHLSFKSCALCYQDQH